jgi:predicted metal-dependent hydrolase
VFADIHASVRMGMNAEELVQTLAWRAGIAWLHRGFFWEAHEALEPVWAALPQNSAERATVQALIQLANAALKQKMGRQGAAMRICALAEQTLPGWNGAPLPMGVNRARLSDVLGEIRAGQAPDFENGVI